MYIVYILGSLNSLLYVSMLESYIRTCSYSNEIYNETLASHLQTVQKKREIQIASVSE